MKKLSAPIFSLFWFGALLMFCSCKNANRDTINLAAGWDYAVPKATLSTVNSNGLVFHSVKNISDLTTIYPRGGVVILRKRFDLDSSFFKYPLSLMLGRIVKADKTFLNGSFLGATGNFPPFP